MKDIKQIENKIEYKREELEIFSSRLEHLQNECLNPDTDITLISKEINDLNRKIKTLNINIPKWEEELRLTKKYNS